MSLEIIKKVYEEKSKNRERTRVETLERVKTALAELSEEVSFKKAYIFGSVTTPYRFTDRSDVDLAFSALAEDRLFYVTGRLSRSLERDVNVVDLDELRFREKILKTGVEWKKS